MEKQSKNIQGNAGDEAFILWLYDEFKPIMFATAGKYMNNSSDREDLVQACLLKLIEKVDTLRGKNRNVLCSYIVYTIKNTAINHLKHQSIVNAHTKDLNEQYEEIPSDALPLDEMIVMTERRDQLYKVWDQLSDEDRNPLEGKYILDQTDNQLATQFHCKPSSIRMKLTRARRKALQLIADKEEKND